MGPGVGAALTTAGGVGLGVSQACKHRRGIGPECELWSSGRISGLMRGLG